MKLQLLLFTILSLLISSCVKEESDFIKGEQGLTYTSNILGIVIDEEGQPIKDANVTFNGVTKTTDANGVYQFKDVEVSDRHSNIRIKKDGYFDGSRAFMTNRKASISLKVILLKKDFDQSFNSNTGGSLKESNINVEFPSDGIVVESTGEKYAGQVNVAIKYMDPNSETIFDEMPGNLSGLNSSQAEVILTTYGMVSIEMQSTNGQKLQIASGKKVKMSNKVPNELLDKAPSTIPLWYFDESLGYWIEEGEAHLVNDSYVGEVGHFSCWNYDLQDPAVTLKGRVIERNGNPVPNATVEIYGEAGLRASRGNTDDAGYFGGLIPKNQLLTIKIFYSPPGCPTEEVYNVQIGPFQDDTDLNDIIIQFISSSPVEIKAQLVNCDGSAVNEGYLKVGTGNSIVIIPVENGEIESNIFVCNNLSSLEFEGIDPINLISSDIIVKSISSKIDLGQVIVCGHEPDYITLKIEEIGLDTIITTGLKGIDQEGLLKKFKNESNAHPYANVDMDLAWNGLIENGIIPGLYNTNNSLFHLSIIRNINRERFYFESGSITIIQGGENPGDEIKGEIDFIISSHDRPETFPMTATFKLRLN